MNCAHYAVSSWSFGAFILAAFIICAIVGFRKSPSWKARSWIVGVLAVLGLISYLGLHGIL
jgi:hypothetical protein